MELQGGYFKAVLKLFWGYFGPLGAHQTTLSYSLPKGNQDPQGAPKWLGGPLGPLGAPT